MTMQDDDILIRPGRIKDRSRGANKAKSFVGEVMRAAKKAGHTGEGFARVGGTKHRSTFGRARQAALALSRKKFSRRVVVMARIVRHQGKRFRAAPLARHAAYLERDGVTRDGRDAKMFNLAPDDADAKAFAERCEDDRHHFRFTISPDDATDMEDLRAFSRDLTKDVARDLGTKLDWVAVDHWNTDNPHIHILIQGRAADGHDLVISRDYISQGFHGNAPKVLNHDVDRLQRAGRHQLRDSARIEKKMHGSSITPRCVPYWT